MNAKRLLMLFAPGTANSRAYEDCCIDGVIVVGLVRRRTIEININKIRVFK